MSTEQTPDIETAVWNVCDEIIADHPMWIGDDGKPLNYLPEREARIADFVRELADTSAQALAAVLAAAVREALRDVAHRLTQMAVMEFGAHGPNAPRGAAIWDSAQWVLGRADRVAEPQHEAATSGDTCLRGESCGWILCKVHSPTEAATSGKESEASDE